MRACYESTVPTLAPGFELTSFQHRSLQGLVDDGGMRRLVQSLTAGAGFHNDHLREP